LSETAFLKEKASLLSALEGRLKQSKAHIQKSEERLRLLKSDTHFQHWADLIMAHIHTIPSGSEKVKLEDYSKPGTFLEIPLRKEHSPQKNAETYYRKSKNRVIEEETLIKLLQPKREELIRLTELLNTAIAADDLAVIRELANQLSSKARKQEEITLPYRTVEFKGFQIWIGKNATANDELTLKYSYKEDLWLHAKDVAGSHVLIKYQSGKPFPKDVIERAASLAAWYSKRKNESLCPVAYTPKKFVRKRKGDPAGAVVVERESVIMVDPAEAIGL
jgi:predicted ribosome quality control (RQC) complex YloA/Tae2 family protein